MNKFWRRTNWRAGPTRRTHPARRWAPNARVSTLPAVAPANFGASALWLELPHRAQLIATAPCPCRPCSCRRPSRHGDGGGRLSAHPATPKLRTRPRPRWLPRTREHRRVASSSPWRCLGADLEATNCRQGWPKARTPSTGQAKTATCYMANTTTSATITTSTMSENANNKGYTHACFFLAPTSPPRGGHMNASKVM